MNKGVMIGAGVGAIAIILGILIGTGVIDIGGDTTTDGVNIAQPTTQADLFKQSKYSNSDVDEIKELASGTCKHDSLPCRQNNILAVPVTVIDYDKEEHLNAELEILTPYVLTIIDIAESERNYEEYTDQEVKELLVDDSIFIRFDDLDFNPIKNVGKIDTIVIKEGEKIYTGEKNSDYYELFDFGDIVFNIEGYTEIHDKEVRIVLVGAEGELEIPINLENYK